MELDELRVSFLIELMQKLYKGKEKRSLWVMKYVKYRVNVCYSSDLLARNIIYKI